MTGELVPSPLRPTLPGSFLVPAIVAGAGDKASEHFLEFFAATIRNPNTRVAYMQDEAQFFRWCEGYDLHLMKGGQEPPVVMVIGHRAPSRDL